MTTPNNFDRVLHAWLGEAAPSSAPTGLHAQTMDVARQRRQRVAWTVELRDALAVRPSDRISLVVRIAAVTMLTLLIGIAFFTGIGRQPTPPPVPLPSPMFSPSPSPSPSPAPTIAGMGAFLRPFSFVLPAGEEVELQRTTSHLFRMSEAGGYVAGHGVTVAIVEAPWGHQCGANGGSLLGRTTIRDTPAEFLADFEAEGRLGVALTERAAPTTLDGHPALASGRAQMAGCAISDLHVGAGDAISLETAARMVVAEVDGLTVLVDVWAVTDEELEGWLPAAMEFVNSIDFIDPAPTTEGIPTLSPTPAPTTALVDDFLRPFWYDPSDEPSIRGERANSRLFRFSGLDASSPWGVNVAVLDSAVVHECPEGGGRANIRVTPAEFLADLEAIAGIALTEPTPGTLDGHPALMTSRTQSSLGCGFADVHINDDPDFFGIAPAGQSLVADIDGLTVFVDIWSRTDAGLEAWLPAAMLFVNSIHFTSQP